MRPLSGLISVHFLFARAKRKWTKRESTPKGGRFRFLPPFENPLIETAKEGLIPSFDSPLCCAGLITLSLLILFLAVAAAAATDSPAGGGRIASAPPAETKTRCFVGAAASRPLSHRGCLAPPAARDLGEQMSKKRRRTQKFFLHLPFLSAIIIKLFIRKPDKNTQARRCFKDGKVPVL